MQSVVNLINRLINIQIFASYFAILHNYLTLTAESQDKYAQKNEAAACRSQRDMVNYRSN